MPFCVVYLRKNTVIYAKCSKDRPQTRTRRNNKPNIEQNKAEHREPTWSLGKLLRHSNFNLQIQLEHCSFCVSMSVCVCMLGILNACCLFIYLSTCHPGSSFRNTYKQISIKHTKTRRRYRHRLKSEISKMKSVDKSK